MPREIPRANRVAEQVQRTLAEMLRRDVRDPRLKPVTITHVKMSPDLSHAWVYFELLTGDAHDALQDGRRAGSLGLVEQHDAVDVAPARTLARARSARGARHCGSS